MSDEDASLPEDAPSEPSAATITFSLPAGIYAFKIKSGGANVRNGSIPALPSVKIDLAPGLQDATVTFLSAPDTLNNYLAYDDDVVVARVAGGAALFMLVSLQLPGQEALALDVARLDVPAAGDDAENPVLEFAPDWTSLEDAAEGTVVPAGITIFLPTGDRLEFADGWACSVVDVQWLEAFAITPAEGGVAEFLEYGAIVEGQMSSEWQPAGELCGIPGSNVPLQGFAVRTKPGVEAPFGCHYFGVFASGLVVGPVSNGDLCASEVPDDPLVRIDLRLIQRPAPAKRRGVAGMQRV